MNIDVILISYNQENYIRKAIESVLFQELDNLEINLLVADDCSTDNTLNLIKSYESVSSICFTYVVDNENIGASQKYKHAFSLCNGDYVAILEGDDYWCSPYHLQNHVNFLERHRECVFSFNRLYLYWEEQKNIVVESEWNSVEDYLLLNTSTLAKWNCLGNLSACMFRLDSIQRLPDELYDIVIDDWSLGLYLGQFGFIGKLKEITSVYRKHEGGLWSGKKQLDLDNLLIHRITLFDALLEHRFALEFKEQRDIIELRYKVRKLPKISLRKRIKAYSPPILICVLKLLTPPIFYIK